MNGIIPLWKEKGMTSHDCVFKVRKILQMKKVGHGGTLDPEVDGILPICIGKGTKLLEFLHDSPKTYFGEITLGFSTSTEDAYGEIVEKRELEDKVSEELVDKHIEKMIGEIVQIPPMYSAVKVNGKRLYEYAREGIEVQRPKRQIEIYEFKRMSDISYDSDSKTCCFSFLVTCSKGTYVRTLSVDLGHNLGLPSHMSKLTRLSSGGLKADQGITLNELENLAQSKQLDKAIISLEEVLKNTNKYQLSTEEFLQVKNGRFLTNIEYQGSEITLWYKDKIIAIYEYKSNYYKPKKMLQLETGD